MKQIKIVVASHKPYWMPKDSMYIPVQVGATGKKTIEGFQRDDEGENISWKNPYYSELTALYWAWKNIDAEYIGLAHYRRHFRGAGERNTLTSKEALALLSKTPILVPKKRRYVIETIESHYAHTMEADHMRLLRSCLGEIAPSYTDAFEKRMMSRSLHIFNMVIMRRDFFNEWCSWLFPILEAVESRMDFASMSPFQARAVGRLSEVLLDVWLLKKRYEYSEIAISQMESVNWLKKGSAFLMAKFFGRKYSESF